MANIPCGFTVQHAWLSSFWICFLLNVTMTDIPCGVSVQHA